MLNTRLCRPHTCCAVHLARLCILQSASIRNCTNPLALAPHCYWTHLLLEAEHFGEEQVLIQYTGSK